MSDILAKICEQTRIQVASNKDHVSQADLEQKIVSSGAVRPFKAAIDGVIALGDNAVIAEIKRASPSKGMIRQDFDAVSLATSYEQAGAVCLSVLTDQAYFKGSAEYLINARANVSLPVLRKDFMLDPYQVYEARAMGADCILIIMAALEQSEAIELEMIAHDLGMDVLIEVHNVQELDRASGLKSRLIGFNNRDLKTLAVDLKTSEELVDKCLGEYTIICESGIKSYGDIQRMNRSGIRGFLVGESLMSQDDVGQALTSLLGR